MDPRPALERRIAGLAALDQPVRRDLYRLLASTDGWTSRDAAAAALGLPRSVVAFHLDKLAEAGVLDVHFARTSGRQGPGAGRPSKLYRPSAAEVAASVPDRRYDLAGSLLADAVTTSTRTGTSVDESLHAVAHETGRRIGASARARADDEAGNDDDPQARVMAVLSDQGYEPELGRRGEIVLANCPFHRLAEEHRDLVCGMNLDLLDGLLAGAAPASGLRARLDPAPGLCCVRIAAA